MIETDIPDLIAGALGVSRGTAYDMMREALAEAQQEPVAWGNLANWCLDSDRVLITDKDDAAKYHRDVYDLTPLYTTPQAQPAREWVGLTKEDKAEIVAATERDDRGYVMALVEAKLKEKNT